MDFCSRIAKQVMVDEIRKGLNKNTVVSPVSFNVALSMVAAGTRGETLDQFLGCLNSKSLDDLNSKSSQFINVLRSPQATGSSEGPLLTIVNGVWVDQRCSPKPSYQHVLQHVFEAEARVVDFLNKSSEVTHEVNSWIEAATKGLIKNLLSPPDFAPDTLLVLANALYFKGAWEPDTFDASRTMPRDFHLLDGTTVSVPFMTERRSNFHSYGFFDGFKVVEIPYRNGKDGRQFSMCIFLPDQRDEDGLLKLVQEFETTNGFSHQLSNLEKVVLDNFWIPKFKFSYGFKASTVIKELGLTKPFQALGDFTEISDSLSSNLLLVSEILHKSCVEVNEEGTVAAAVTVSLLLGSSRLMSPPKPSFVADHPFIFLIREAKSGAVLFSGAVVNPLLEN